MTVRSVTETEKGCHWVTYNFQSCVNERLLSGKVRERKSKNHGQEGNLPSFLYPRPPEGGTATSLWQCDAEMWPCRKVRPPLRIEVRRYRLSLLKDIELSAWGKVCHEMTKTLNRLRLIVDQITAPHRRKGDVARCCSMDWSSRSYKYSGLSLHIDQSPIVGAIGQAPSQKINRLTSQPIAESVNRRVIYLPTSSSATCSVSSRAVPIAFSCQSSSRQSSSRQRVKSPIIQSPTLHLPVPVVRSPNRSSNTSLVMWSSH